MKKLRDIEEEWITNFKKSPLVDSSNMSFKSQIAHQLFYGKQDDSYSSDYPQSFIDLFNELESIERDLAIDNILEFLHFIGIKIQKQKIINYLEKFPNEFTKLTRKFYYILKLFKVFVIKSQ